MNPFNQQLCDLLRGRRVLVESNNGQRFEGYLDRVHFQGRHVLLRDVHERPGGACYPSGFVADVDWIVPATGYLEITEVELSELQRCDFAVADFDPDANSEFIQTVANRGFVGDFPVVTHNKGGLELVEGHKRLWVAEQACLGSIPVVVESLSEREQAARFAFDHFPLPHELDGDGSRDRELYSDAELRLSLDRYLEAFGEDALEIFPVRFNAERLNIQP